MAVSVIKLGQLCTAAAASGGLLAVATPEHSVVLLKRTGAVWQNLREGYVLSEGHEATVTALSLHCGASSDAAGGSSPPLRLASSSHDRNSYVWTQQQEQQGAAAPDGWQQQQQQQQQQGRRESGSSSGQWRAELVITRLSKAGLCCAWDAGGLKFAIGSVDGLVDVVFLDASRELWAPKLIKKRHGGAVMALAWHPAGAALATACADGRLRLLNAVLPEVDGPSSLAALAGSRFGDCLLELSLPGGGWGLAAAFSPDGSSLAVASQGPEGSHLTILTGIDPSAPSSLDAAAIEAEATAAAAGSGAAPRLQRLPLPSLPLKCLAYLSDSMLAGGGFDCQPQLFARRTDGRWQFARSLAGAQASSNADEPLAAAPASLSARIKLFEQQAAAASAAGVTGKPAVGGGRGNAHGVGSSSSSGGGGSLGPHEGCIVSISPLPNGRPGDSLRFVTASVEGCIAEWHVDPAIL